MFLIIPFSVLCSKVCFVSYGYSDSSFLLISVCMAYPHTGCNFPGSLPKGEGRKGGADWEFGISKFKILHVEWINNKVLFITTGNYI